MKKYFLYILLLISGLPAVASHIVGAELYYDNLGSNNYKVTLKLYRNCDPNCGCAQYSAIEYVQIFDSVGNYVGYIPMNLPPTDTIPPVITNPCLTPIDVCIEEAVFTGNYTFPPIAGGYTLVYQRCCRNSAIQSIPNNTGATYVAHIANDRFPVNSSPRFSQRPPLFICADSYLQFDNSATDPDGDSLSYSLVNALDGASGSCPDPSPNTTPGGACPSQASAPPYLSVPYISPYSSANPTNSPVNSGDLQIDPVTGLLTGIPNQTGIFVVAVAVSEYRNGIYIDQTIRDYQFNIVQCNIPTVNLVYLPGTFNPTTNFGVYQVDCSNRTVDFSNVQFSNSSPTNITPTYSWNFGVPGSTTDTSTQEYPTFTYPDTGTYYVTVAILKTQGTQQCADTAHALVEIYPTLTAAFSFTSGCQDSAAVFTDHSVSTTAPLNSWNWSFGDGQSSNLQNPTHHYASAGSYTVILTAGNNKGCIDTISKTVVINPLPAPNFTANSLCIYDTAQFIYTGTGQVSNYYWNLGNGVTSTQQNTSTAYNTAGPVSISLVTTNQYGCRDTLIKTLTVHPLPVITTTSPSAKICPYTTAQLTASGAVSYSWSPTSSLNNAMISDPIADPGTGTTYTVTGTDANGCSNTASLFINVYPVPQINAGPDTSVCYAGANFNTSVQLTATGGVSYIWTPATGLSNTTVANPIASPTSNQTYYVASTDTDGCTATDSVTVFVLNPALNLIVESTKTICDKDTTTLTVLRQGDSYYNWSPPTGISDPSSNSPNFFPDVTTTYYFTVRNYCYTKMDTATIIVHPLPNVTTQGIDSVCVGGSVQFMAAGADTFVWQADPTLSSTTIADPVATPTATDTYYVTGIDTFGCRKKDSVLVYVFPPPTPGIGPDTPYICQGKPIRLVATGGTNYVWRADNSLSALNISNPIANPTDTQWYYVTVYNVHQCHADDSIIVNVQQPVLPVAATPYDICVGGTVQLSASGGYYYAWTPNLWLSDTAVSNPISKPDSSIVYTVTVSNYCFSASTQVDVVVHQSPTVYAGSDTTIYRNTDAVLTGTTNGSTYYWYPSTNVTNASSLVTTTDPLYTTMYYLYSVSEFGCHSYDSVLITVEPYTLIQIPTAFSPNGDGVNDIFHIIRTLNIESIQEFAVYDRWGAKVFSTDVITDGWNGTYKGREEPIDVYVWFVKGITYDGQEITQKGNVTLVR